MERLFMKTCILPFLFTFCSLFALAQPDLEHSLHINYKKCWPRNASNIRKDHIFKAIQHSNGSVYGLVVPFSSNTSGKEVGLVRLNNDFDTLWSIKYGGSKEDALNFVLEMTNGDLLLCGYSESKDGDVWYGRTFCSREIWLMIVDTNGVIKKGKTFGGSNGSDLSGAFTSQDGSIYLSGTTLANDYDFAHFQYNFLNTDPWIAKLDSSLNLKWVKALSSNEDEGYAFIRPIGTDRLIFGCPTSATNPDFLPNEARGALDHYVCLLDTAGNIVWRHRYGGPLTDFLEDIVVDPDHMHIYLIGYGYSQGGDYTYSTTQQQSIATPTSANTGIIRIDTSGTVYHGKMYGPSTKYMSCEGSSYLFGAKFYKGRLWTASYIIGSNSCYPLGPGWGDADSNSSYAANTLIMVIDSNCNLRAKYTLNGNGNDEVWDNFIKDSVLYFTGFNGGLPNNQTNTFRCDTANTFQFIISFTNTPLEVTEPPSSLNNKKFTIYPNPTQDILTIQPQESSAQEVYTLRILSIDGRLMYRASKLKGRKQLQIADWPVGIYYAELEQKGIRQNITFSKQ